MKCILINLTFTSTENYWWGKGHWQAEINKNKEHLEHLEDS